MTLRDSHEVAGMNGTYTVHVHDEPDGTWWADVDELPGCFASGHDRAEVTDHVTEAIHLYLAESGRPVRIMLAPGDMPPA